MIEKIELKGFQELERKLREFGPRMERNGLRAANSAGAAVFRDAARALIQDSPEPSAPGEPPKSKTGQLRKAIVIFKRRGAPGKVEHSVGVRGERQTYGDTRENRRRRRVGKKFVVETRNSLVGRLLEFGTSKMAARPWLKPAFINNTDRAIDAVREKLAKVIERASGR